MFQHDYGFDPAYGMDLAQMLAIEPPQPPADFADFWRARYQAALTVDPLPHIQPTGRMLGEHLVHDLRYTSTGGVEIGGWLLAPADGRVTRGLVIGHGYAGRDTPDQPFGLDDAALLFPCFRGLSRSAMPGVSQNPHYHVLHDIQDRHRYLIGGCVEDIWLGVSALLALFPRVAGRVAYLGLSLGGGLGALAAPWDDRIGKLFIQVPTFGHHPLRLTLPCVGSGEAVRGFQRHHPELNVLETLAYYDAASAARYLGIPTLVAAALFDPAVPPPGQFAIHNAIPKPWRHLSVLKAGHFGYPGETARQQELNREIAAFLMAP